MPKRIERKELVEKIQPVLDLFDLGITPFDVAEFGYSPGDSTDRELRNDSLYVKVYVRDENNTKTGTVTHNRWFS